MMQKESLLQRAMAWFKFKRAPGDPLSTSKSLSDWTQTPLAEEVLSSQKEVLDDVLTTLFGYHLVELSSFSESGLSRSSKINHCSVIARANQGAPGAIAQFERLPLLDESIDVILLHHALDYSEHPHQVLREASRVLIARGHMVVVGFNPISWMGFYKLVKQFFSRGWFWRRNSLTPHRIKDWLRLLELETIDARYGFYRPPFNNSSLLSKASFFERVGRRFKLPFGGYYILIARKERLGVTPIKPLWGSLRGVGAMGVRKSSAGMVEPSGRVKPPIARVDDGSGQ